MTDESYIYRGIGREFVEHIAVHHYNKEYVRGDITTNTVEGAFSIFKRGMRGVYQHCAEKHLHRYLAEFGFADSHREATGSDDTARADRILKGVVGKRRPTNQLSRGHDAKSENPISEEERSRRFEEEVRKRKEAGDFDQDAAEAAVAVGREEESQHP